MMHVHSSDVAVKPDLIEWIFNLIDWSQFKIEFYAKLKATHLSLLS